MRLKLIGGKHHNKTKTINDGYHWDDRFKIQSLKEPPNRLLFNIRYDSDPNEIIEIQEDVYLRTSVTWKGLTYYIHDKLDPKGSKILNKRYRQMVDKEHRRRYG